MADESCMVKGVMWHKYLFEFKTADGTFGSHFYAISDEHARLVLTELKETATLLGRSGGTVPLHDERP